MEYVKIGEVNNYSNHNPYRGAHGCGTYVIHLNLAAEKTRYAIEIPEIYSAYRFYVNDELVGQWGSPERVTKITGKGFRRKSIPLRQQASVHCFWRREMNPIITAE